MWTSERSALTDACDILLMILAALNAQRTGKTQKPQQLPRPVTARQRYEEAAAYRRHRERVRKMIPASRR